MVQTYNYETEEIKTYNTISDVCKDLNMRYETVLNHVYRRTCINKTTILVHGKIDEDIIKELHPKVYYIKNLKTKEVKKFFHVPKALEYMNNNIDYHKTITSEQMFRYIREYKPLLKTFEIERKYE